MIWECIDCTVINEGDAIIVENRFAEPSDFELSTNIVIEKSQNIRLTIEFLDYVADLTQDNSFARSNIEAYLDYGENDSPKTLLVCAENCLKGVFVGNLDIQNPNPMSGLFKLIVKIHAFNQDKFKMNLISLGDLILSSQIFEENKGMERKSKILYYES